MYQTGSAVLQVTQPSTPCFKLGIKFGSPDMIGRFLKSRKSGFYFTVILEGIITAGNQLTLLGKGDPDRTIPDVVNEQIKQV